MSLNFKNKSSVRGYGSPLSPGSMEYGFKTEDILGDIEIANPPTSEPEVKDSLDYARHCWRKGNLEFMGGYTAYEQGHGVEGYKNQNRVRDYAPLNAGRDEMANELEQDTPEN